jgi:hypothetical protein
MKMEAEWKKAIRRFLLNNLGQMEQTEVDAWLSDELDLAPLLEPPLKAMSPYRAQVLRELHQISPGEIFDAFRNEHPELVFQDKNKAILKIGKELEAMKAMLLTM